MVHNSDRQLTNSVVEAPVDVVVGHQERAVCIPLLLVLFGYLTHEGEVVFLIEVLQVSDCAIRLMREKTYKILCNSHWVDNLYIYVSHRMFSHESRFEFAIKNIVIAIIELQSVHTREDFAEFAV